MLAGFLQPRDLLDFQFDVVNDVKLHLFADSAYDRLKLMDKAAYLDFVLEIIRRREDARGFEVLPRRWLVERTFGWVTGRRRLVRDYERRIDVSKAMILVAMGMAQVQIKFQKIVIDLPHYNLFFTK